MQTLDSSTWYVTIISACLFVLLLTLAVTFLIVLYRRRQRQYEIQIIELREVFSQTLLQSKLEIQEQTLDHIAKELHSNFSHLVSLININLAEILSQSPAEMKESVIETKSLAKQLLSDLKALSASLNTDHIMHIGFVNALNNELNRLGKARKLQVTMTKNGDCRLVPEHEIILFRLCQEVFNNIMKYAKATSVNVCMDCNPGHFRLKIVDNGVGFNVEEALFNSANKQSTGIINIQKRAKLINAEVSIVSKENKGTSVEIGIPRLNPAN